jgi:hypothetical protein
MELTQQFEDGRSVMGYLDLSRVSSEASESKATCTHDLCTMV